MPHTKADSGNTGFPLFSPAPKTDYPAGKPYVVFPEADGNSSFAKDYPM